MKICSIVLFCLFVTVPYYVAHDSPKLTLFYSQFSEGWDYRSVPPHPAWCANGFVLLLGFFFCLCLSLSLPSSLSVSIPSSLCFCPPLLELLISYKDSNKTVLEVKEDTRNVELRDTDRI